MAHNPLNVFTSSAPRVNAAASDFNSISNPLFVCIILIYILHRNVIACLPFVDVPSPISGYSDFTSSQATVLYDTSTAKSSGDTWHELYLLIF